MIEFVFYVRVREYGNGGGRKDEYGYSFLRRRVKSSRDSLLVLHTSLVEKDDAFGYWKINSHMSINLSICNAIKSFLSAYFSLPAHSLIDLFS